MINVYFICRVLSHVRLFAMGVIIKNFIASLRHSTVTPMLAIAFFAFSVMANAATNYVVTSNQYAADPYTNWHTAGTNLIDVMNAAMTNTSPRLVMVSNGTYNLTNTVYITNVIVQSVNGRSSTIVNGGYPDYTNRCFYIREDSGQTSVLDGFTITNGRVLVGATRPPVSGGGVSMSGGLVKNCDISWNVASNGGALYFAPGSSGGVVSNCNICSNAAIGSSWGYGGGGICVDGAAGSVKIKDCLVSSNYSTTTAGGMSVAGTANVVVTNCVVANNRAPNNSGGGVFIYGNTNVQISHCSISNNFGGFDGGGIYCYASSAGGLIDSCVISSNRANGSTGGGGVESAGYEIRNCLIFNNTSGTRGGGVILRALSTVVASTIVSNYAPLGSGILLTNEIANTTNWLLDCVVWSNDVYQSAMSAMSLAGTNLFYYNCLPSTNGCDGAGNITNDPLFVGFAGGNYRLSAGSPCVNAGTNQSWMTNVFDLDGRMRIRYGTVDMGAYETIYEGTFYKMGF